MQENNKDYPAGHFVGMWMGIGAAIFSGLGIPLSIATENMGLIGIGPAIGVAFGLAVGASIEAKYKKEGKSCKQILTWSVLGQPTPEICFWRILSTLWKCLP